MTFSLARTVPPNPDFLLDATVYDHLRVAASPSDASLIGTYKSAAMAHIDGADGVLGRAVINQTWALKAANFPQALDRIHGDARLILPLPPLQSVASVQYVDTAGVTQTLAPAEYTVLTAGWSRGAIVPAYGKTWPSTRTVPDALTVTFVCGFGAAVSDVPDALIAAGLLLVGHWYDHREAVAHAQTVAEVPVGVAALLDPFRVVEF